MVNRKCLICNLEKPLDSLHFRLRESFSFTCIVCNNESNRLRNNRNNLIKRQEKEKYKIKPKDGYKICSKCGDEKSLSEFYKNKGDQCKNCHKSYRDTPERKALKSKQDAERRKNLPPEIKLFRNMKKNAINRNLQFNLTIEDIKIPECCPVLGIPIDYSNNEHEPSGDRIDNSKGYTKDNVTIISYKANRLKSDMNRYELSKLYEYFMKFPNFI